VMIVDICAKIKLFFTGTITSLIFSRLQVEQPCF
jgi:hypothetical protein